MADMSEPETTTELLRPPRWLRQLGDVLQRLEPELWSWFSAPDQEAKAGEAARLDLLQTAVVLPRPLHSELYRSVEEAAQRLNLSVPVTLYQPQQAPARNASVSIDTRAARIVLHGNLREQLDERELRAVLGHELGHLILWRTENRRYLTAGRLLDGLCDDPAAHSVFLETRRLLDLYTEVFCDRCALIAQGDLSAVVSALVKLDADLSPIDPSGNRNEAGEMPRSVTGIDEVSRGLTHPALDIRASALRLWQGQPDGCDSEIDALIHGPLTLTRLDLVGQQAVTDLTRQILDAMLAPSWMQSDASLAHARLFFPDYQFPSPSRFPLAAELRTIHNRQLGENYTTFLLLDFVTVNQELREPALAHAMAIAETLEFREPFCEAAQRELRLRKRQLDAIEDQGLQMIGRSATAESRKSGAATTVEANPSGDHHPEGDDPA
jgi:hypothetical protein